LDTSVIVKWFVDEPDAPAALWLRAGQNSGRLDLVIMELSFYELANAMKACRTIPEDDIHAAIAALEMESLDMVPFNTEILHSAVETSREAGISVYDAYFVAAADLLGCRLVTADRKLAAKLRGSTDIVTLDAVA
jgi:predicted nucleic acid-binding protein